MADFTIRDNNTKLRITCLKRDGSPFNLTGHTIKMRFRIREVDHVTVDMIIIDAALGIVEYEFVLGSGIVIGAGINDALDIDLDVTSFPPGMSTIIIPPATYLTAEDLALVIDGLVKAIEPSSECTIVSGKFKIANPAYPMYFYFGSGPSVATSAAITLGFFATDEDLGLDFRLAENVPLVTLPDDLAEQGIMYAEFEITETSTGRLVSSSEVTTFVVRGKVTDG